MNIGILDKIKNNRYLISPDTAKLLSKSGSNVYFTTEIEKAYNLEIAKLKFYKFKMKEELEVKKIFLFIKKQLNGVNNFTLKDYELIKNKIETRIKKLYRDKVFKDIELIKSIYEPFYNKITGHVFLSAGAIRRENNVDIIKNSNILTCYNIPKEELELIEEKHILVSYSNALKNKVNIQSIANKKASLLAIEHIKDVNGENIIQKIISSLSAKVGFSLINSILNEQGVILGNIPFNQKLNITIIGYGTIGKEISNIFNKFYTNITVFDQKMDILGDNSNFSFFSIHNEIKLKESIENSDLIVSAIGNNLSPCAKIITKEHIKNMRNKTLLFDFSINQGGIIEDPIETKYRSNIPELYNIDKINRNFLYSGISEILSTSNISVSNYISNALVLYLSMILEGKSDLRFFENAFLVKEGSINEKITFLENNEDIIPNIEDPFDLMDEEITESWRRMDDVNELLDEAKDYGETSTEKDKNSKRE